MKNPLDEFKENPLTREFPLINQLLHCISELSPLEKHDEYGRFLDLLARNQIMEFYGEYCEQRKREMQSTIYGSRVWIFIIISLENILHGLY